MNRRAETQERYRVLQHKLEQGEATEADQIECERLFTQLTTKTPEEVSWKTWLANTSYGGNVRTEQEAREVLHHEAALLWLASRKVRCFGEGEGLPFSIPKQVEDLTPAQCRGIFLAVWEEVNTGQWEWSIPRVEQREHGNRRSSLEAALALFSLDPLPYP